MNSYSTVIPLSGDHPHQHIQHQLEQRCFHVHGPVPVIILRKPPQESSDFVRPYAGEAVEAVRGEDLQGHDPPQVPPVVPVRRPNQARVVVADVLAEEEAGAVGEDDVVLGEAFLGGGGGGYDQDAAGAELEEEDGAVAVRDGGEGAVEGLPEEVEVAEDGEGREGTGREVADLVD